MVGIRFGVLLIVSFALIGCSSDKALKEAVLDTLKDPDSAKFGEITYVGDGAACVTVNAKNAMGGYTGNQQAFMQKSGGKWHSLGVHESSVSSCVQLMSEMNP